jgi:hypothetical protein
VKILIEVELEELGTDGPSYTARVHDALLRLIASQLESGDFGVFTFEREWGRGYWPASQTQTTVRVSKAPPAVPEMIEAEKKAREEVARIKADVAATLNFSPKGS